MEKTKSKSRKKTTKNPYWKGYRQLGMKRKNGRRVPNCVPEESSSPES